MDENEPRFLPVRDLAGLIATRRVSAVEVARAYLERIEQVDGDLRAFITVDGERVLAEARAADDELGRGGVRGPLHGVPLAIKDNIATRGLRTTAGSRIF